MSHFKSWEEGSKKNFEDILLPLKGQKLNCLQIGVYVGDTSKWLMENILTHEDSRLFDVDPWPVDMCYRCDKEHKIEETYDTKLKKYLDQNKIIKNKLFSYQFFKNNNEEFDFIYIDGDHFPTSIVEDGLNALRCIKIGGIIAFDDYLYMNNQPDWARPSVAIESIVNSNIGMLEVLLVNSQVWVKRIK
jgi:predicted O-methyltransferase YrrM